MKTFIFSILFAFILFPVAAQNNTQAQSLLDKVANKYQSQKTFYLKFHSELQNNKTNTQDSFDGQVYVKKDQYNLTIPQMDIQQIYDGAKLYTISKDQKEVTVTQPQPNSNELFTPTRVFQMYKKGYSLSMDKTSKVNGKNIQFVRLTPTTKSDIQYVLIGVDTQSSEMVQLIETNSNNTVTTVTIEKQLNNIIIPSPLLKFNKKNFKGYYISEI